MKIVDAKQDGDKITWTEVHATPDGEKRVTKSAKIRGAQEVSRTESTARKNERNG